MSDTVRRRVRIAMVVAPVLLGLFVALPAVVAYNWAQEKIAAIEASVASFRKLLTASLQVINARSNGTVNLGEGV